MKQYSKLIADKIVAEPVSENSAEKMKYNIDRGVDEVSKLVDDINFDLGGIIKEGKSKIKSIAINEDGSGVIKLVKELKIDDGNVAKTIPSKIKNYSIPGKFASNITWDIICPEIPTTMAPAPSVVRPEEPKAVVEPAPVPSAICNLNARIKVAVEIIEDAVKGDPTQNWKGAISFLEKLGKEYLNVL